MKTDLSNKKVIRLRCCGMCIKETCEVRDLTKKTCCDRDLNQRKPCGGIKVVPIKENL